MAGTFRSSRFIVNVNVCIGVIQKVRLLGGAANVLYGYPRIVFVLLRSLFLKKWFYHCTTHQIVIF